MYYSEDQKITPRLTENALRVLRKRYLRGETPEEMFWRVAKAVAVAEESYLIDTCDPGEIDLVKNKLTTSFYNMMASLDFLPNSPTLMNAGRPLGQLAGCFVVPVEDSMEAIAQGIMDMMLIQKSGGGTGFSFSKLRPSGDPVTTTIGEASGPVSFMRAYNAVTEVVKQGGARRGANMGILRVDHPDIMEFIDVKSDLSELTNFNMSVAITDEFMECLLNNQTFTLRFNGVEYAKIDPWDIMNRMVHRAWCTGEPGWVFIDKINRDNPTPALGEIESTNPCIVGDTLIKTVEGMIPIKDLVGQEIDVYCVNDNYQLTIRKAKNIRLTKKNAQLVKVSTTKGDVICTPEHKFYTRNRGYIEAQHLKITDKLVALNVAPIVLCIKNQKYTKVYLTGTGDNVPAEHVFIAQHYYGNIDGKNVHHKDNDPTHNYFSNIEVLNHGNHSSITNKGHVDWMEHDPNTGRWLPKVKEKKDWSNKYPVGVNMRLLSVTPLDYVEDVYDMEVEECHNFFANYVLIHNCGEQPLLPYEACNLGSINLVNMVKQQPVKSKIPAENIDWARLKAVTWGATRFLDNVVDVNHYPLPQIKENAQGNRKIGLGVMGWGDLLYQIGVPYDSEEARLLAMQVMKFIQDESHMCSVELAKEKGCFPNWDKSIWGERGIPMRNAATITIAPTGTLSVIAGVSSGIEPLFGLYYVKDLSSGTIGEGKLTVLNEHLLARLIDMNMPQEQIDMIIEHLKAKGTLQGIEMHITPDLQEVFNIFKVASDINPMDHIRMQAAFQKYTDNAVSKTINFNNDVTEQEILEAVIGAWKMDCKGLTIYRDGSRDSQPLTKGSTPSKAHLENLEEIPASVDLNILDEMCMTCPARQGIPQKIKRPSKLPGMTEVVNTGCGKMYVTINHLNGKILEVFCDTGKSGGCTAFTEGTSRLISIALRYGVPVGEIIDQLSSVRCDNFRHQTGKNPGLKGKSCPDVIGTVIKDMLKEIGPTEVPTIPKLQAEDITKIFTGNGDEILLQALHPHGTEEIVIPIGHCPDCGNKLENSEGCCKCNVCGFSKC